MNIEDNVNRVTLDEDNFHIDLGNCGTSSIFTGTLHDNCIVIKKNENKDKNDSKKVVLKLDNATIEVRFFSDGGNTYDKNKKGTLGNSGFTFKDIAIFLSEYPGDFNSRYSADEKEIKDKLNMFISVNSLNDWVPLINRFGTNVVASVTGGSHKRYRKSRKSRKYQSRKKYRRHIKRHKRTHRHKSRSSSK